jgi:hypothetical protein
MQLARLYKIYMNAGSVCSRNLMRQGAIEPSFKWTFVQTRKSVGQTQVAILPATAAGAKQRCARSIEMLDFIMLALGLAFFAVSVGYTMACDRL